MCSTCTALPGTRSAAPVAAGAEHTAHVISYLPEPPGFLSYELYGPSDIAVPEDLKKASAGYSVVVEPCAAP